MRPTLRFLASIVVGVVMSCALSAQAGDQSAETLEQRAAKAIESYEAVRGKKAKAAMAAKQLKWLGQIDHESITDYLNKQLEAAGVGPAAVPILRAIGGAPRRSLEGKVWRVLHHDKAKAAVQQAAVAALLTMGKRSLGRLHGMLRKGKEAARQPVLDAAVRAIVLSKNAEAIRGLVPLFDGGTSDDKLRYLRMIDSVRGVTEISRVRMRLIPRGTQLIAAVAWRQLAEEGHPRAADLVIDVLERMPEGAPANCAAEMITGLAIVRDRELYPLLLRYGSMPGRAIKQALRRAAPHAAKDLQLMAYMARHGLESKRSGARDAALMLLQRAPAEAIRPLVEKVRKALRRPRKSSLDLALSLHTLLAKDPTWKDDVLKLAASPTGLVRTVGLSMLIELGCGEGLVYAQRSLSDRQWELRTAAIRYLTNFRDVQSIPLLISRVGKEDGRIAAELNNALFVHTGTRCYKRSEWDAWWRKNKQGFELPHEDSVRSASVGMAGQTSAYHGIPLVSKKVAFLIDTSGSMGARVGTDKKRTRLDVAKEELRKVLEVIPADFNINLIPYESGVRPMWDNLQPANKNTRAKIRGELKKMRPGGGTNIFGALEIAFRDPDVDTIYLLTDGEPSAGEIVNAEDIAAEIERWNHLRQIVIHCIGLGIDTQLLKDLAAQSGGVYKYVR